MKIRRIMTIMFLLFMMPYCLSACKSGVEMEMSDNVQQLYKLPSNYQEHRSQQQLFGEKGHQIAYTDHGSGPVLVLLHGVPTSSWKYRKIIPELQKDRRVITIDFLGFGSSDKPKDDGEIYTPIENAKRIQALLSYLKIDEYALLMHDMGGLVAWELMRENHQSISHVVVLNTIIHKEGFYPPNIKPGIVSRQLMTAYSNEITSTTILEKTFSALGLVNEHKLNENECFGYVAPLHEGSDQALYAFFTNINDDLFERLDQNQTALSGFKGKTLVLWGEKDETLTTKQIPILQKTLNIPQENIHIYPENNHFLVEEIPEEIVLKVNEFLQ